MMFCSPSANDSVDDFMRYPTKEQSVGAVKSVLMVALPPGNISFVYVFNPVVTKVDVLNISTVVVTVCGVSELFATMASIDVVSP